MITIYTDGSSKGNPGPGGFGAIIFDEEKVKEIGGKKKMTTNNRMEMMAMIEALKYVSGNFADTEEIEVHSDSAYLINGITKWIFGWQKNDWQTIDFKTKNKKDILNKDLWEELYELTQNKKIKWEKVVGHSGHKENERCDGIAQSFADGKKIKLYNGLKSGYKIVS